VTATLLICRTFCVASLCTTALVVAAGCRRETPAPVPDAPAPAPAPPAAPQPDAPVARVDPPRLPEDPIAGKRSEEQWREHMKEEDHELQLAFDRRRLKQHRAVVRLIDEARAQYDRARTEAEVAKIRTAMPKRIAQLRQRMTEIDRWGARSPMSPEYEALSAALTGAYPDAKIAALAGNAQALEQAQATFDQRRKTITDWLEEAAESKDEYE
jgi:prefoldin subunit 5